MFILFYRNLSWELKYPLGDDNSVTTLFHETSSLDEIMARLANLEVAGPDQTLAGMLESGKLSKYAHLVTKR